MRRSLMVIVFAALPLANAASQSGLLTVTDGVGTTVGRLVSLEGGDLTIITARGYLVYLRGRTGAIVSPDESGGTAYLSPDCSGQPFAKNVYIKPLVFLSDWNASQGFEVMYVRGDSVQVTLNPGETYYQWGTIGPNPTLVCFGTQFQIGNDPVRLTPMYPNDLSETGIGSGPFVPPFKISAIAIFQDGFEDA